MPSYELKTEVRGNMYKFLLSALLICSCVDASPIAHIPKSDEAMPKAYCEIILRYPEFFQFHCEMKGITMSTLVKFTNNPHHIDFDDTFYTMLELNEGECWEKDYEPWMMDCLHVCDVGCSRLLVHILDDAYHAVTQSKPTELADLDFQAKALSLLTEMKTFGVTKKNAREFEKLVLSHHDFKAFNWFCPQSDAILMKLLESRIREIRESINRGQYLKGWWS